MLPQILPKDQVPKLVRFLQQNYRVIGPTLQGKHFVYEEIEDPNQLQLEYTNTIQSPKRYFFPSYEVLLKYGRQADRQVIEADTSAPRTALLGVRPCDVYATWLLDDVFSKDVKDPYYLGRRDRAVIIALDCLEPCGEQQFCLDMGSLYVQTGFDLMMTDLGNRYYVETGTEMGENIIREADVFIQATAKDHAAHQHAQENKQSNFKHKIPYETKYLPELLGQSYDSLIWEANARRCLSCGQCNLVCPTCYCFDVVDEPDITLDSGKRVRKWDGCQLRPFAEVAGGENFRPTAGSRLRHRIMRKGKYMREIYGKSGCVGCGRCDFNCPVGISILKTCQQIAAATEVTV